MRTGETGAGLPLAAELARLAAVPAELRQELPLPRELLHAVVGLIGDVDVAVPIDGDAASVLELAVPVARPAPLPQEAAVRAVDAHLPQEQRGDINVAVPVHGDAAGVLGDGEGGEELPLAIELLDPVVVELRDVDAVVLVDGDADGRAELALTLALLAPG